MLGGSAQRSMTQRITTANTVDASPDHQRPTNGIHSHQNSGVQSSAARSKQGDSGPPHPPHQLTVKQASNSSKQSNMQSARNLGVRNSTGAPPGGPSMSNRSSSASFTNGMLQQQVVQRQANVPTKD